MRMQYSRRVRKDGWTTWEVEHIAAHGVTPQEVEEVLLPPYRMERLDADVQALWGQTLAGRFLFVLVTESIRGQRLFVVTARDMEANEVSRYRRARRGR